MKKLNYLIITLILFIPCIIKAEKIEVTLEKCVDGDTAWFNLNSEVIKTRFLALDTPESTNKVEPYGKEASNYTCNSLTNAKKIEIEYDSNSDKKDKYNRHLVWVFIDNELLQEKIIEEGLGEVKYLYGDYKYTDTLNKKQKEAKNNKLNIWSNTGSNDLNIILEKIVNNKIFLSAIIIIIVILFIFNKNIRKKIINKSKKEIKKKLKSFK